MGKVRRIIPQKYLPKKRKHIPEHDFKVGDTVELPRDAYNLTIAANMTKLCSPQQLNYCIKQCIFVFFLQWLIAYFFLYDYVEMKDFQPLDPFKTPLRVCLTLLLLQQASSEMRNALKVMTMPKRMKGSRKHLKGRCVNLIIISCQIISPIITNLVSMLSIAQNPTMIDIIKSYVAMAFIIQIDNIFVTLFPREIIENSE